MLSIVRQASLNNKRHCSPLLRACAISFFYYQLAIGYLHTGRDLRRLDSTSQSAIFSGFGELLEGVATVRAFAVEKRFLDAMHAKIDITTKVCCRALITVRENRLIIS